MQIETAVREEFVRNAGGVDGRGGQYRGIYASVEEKGKEVLGEMLKESSRVLKSDGQWR